MDGEEIGTVESAAGIDLGSLMQIIMPILIITIIFSIFKIIGGAAK